MILIGEKSSMGMKFFSCRPPSCLVVDTGPSKMDRLGSTPPKLSSVAYVVRLPQVKCECKVSALVKVSE